MLQIFKAGGNVQAHPNGSDRKYTRSGHNANWLQSPLTYRSSLFMVQCSHTHLTQRGGQSPMWVDMNKDHWNVLRFYLPDTTAMIVAQPMTVRKFTIIRSIHMCNAQFRLLGIIIISFYEAPPPLTVLATTLSKWILDNWKIKRDVYTLSRPLSLGWVLGRDS